MASYMDQLNREGGPIRSPRCQGVKGLCKFGWVTVLAALVAAAPAWTAPENGQGKVPPRKAGQRAPQQGKRAAKPPSAQAGPGRSGPNARAGTPRPGSGTANAAGGTGQPGGQTGANARAGTPRQAQQQQPVPAPSSVPPPAPQVGIQSGANARAGTAGQRTAGAVPPTWQQRLQQMPPEERERFLNNNEKFRSLPKEQQDQIRGNLAKWDKLSPKQQASMNRNAVALDKMTPEQRDNLRKNVLPQLRTMPAERRQEINQRLGSLNGLSDAERNQKLSDPNFYQGLSPQEHDVLKQLGEYKLTPGAGGY